MKSLIIGLCIFAVFMAVGTACANRTAADTSSTSSNQAPNAQLPTTANSATNTQPNTPASTTNPVSKPQSNAIINVDDLMKSPDGYAGTIRVEGVVSAVSPGQRSIGLIDSREFAQCGVTTCSSFILPVQWAGPMPRVEDTVQVVGEVQKSQGKFIFVAQALENIKQQSGSPK